MPGSMLPLPSPRDLARGDPVRLGWASGSAVHAIVVPYDDPGAPHDGRDPDEAAEDAWRLNTITHAGKPGLLGEWADLYGDEEAQDAWWASHYEGFQPGTCERLAAPPRDAWSQMCIEAMASELTASVTCDRYAPCLNVQSEADFEALMAEEFESDEYYKVRKEPDDPVALEFLAAVWKFINANLDLLGWAACYGGFSSSPHCLAERFAGERTVKTTINFYSDCSFDTGYEGWSPLWPWIPKGGLIKVCMDEKKHFRKMKTMWHNASSAANRVCPIIAVASAFVHEMTHVCGSIHMARRADCEPTQLNETAFEWALLKRYAFAASGRCCAEFYDGGEPISEMFGSRNDYDPEQGCAT